jgi:tetratricopeptide (TPR) repeat protein
MRRSLRVLIPTSMLIVTLALAAVFIWRLEAHRVVSTFVLGVGFVVLGIACTTLHLTLSDDFLRKQAGEVGAAQMRRFWRQGWIGVLLGAGMIGLHYLDHWVQVTTAEAQSRVAFDRGLTAGKAKDWQTAADAFSEAIRFDPKNAMAYRNRGMAYFQQEDYDRSLTDFEEAIRLNPSYAKAYLSRSMVYSKKGDDIRAREDQQKAVELDPSLEKSGGGKP